MADARLQHDWERTAFLTAAVRSSAFGNTKTWDPRKINPYGGLAHRRVRRSAEEIIALFAEALG